MPAWRHGLNHGKIIEKHQDTVSNEDLSHGCPLALILLYLTFLRDVCVLMYTCCSTRLSWAQVACCTGSTGQASSVAHSMW